MEDFESGIVSAGAHGGHVEDVTDRRTSAIDAALLALWLSEKPNGRTLNNSSHPKR
jgi:hypothetical protein